MPRYSHWCPVCAEEFEVDKPMKEAGEPRPCPKCETESPQSFSHPPALHWRNTPKFHP